MERPNKRIRVIRGVAVGLVMAGLLVWAAVHFGKGTPPAAQPTARSEGIPSSRPDRPTLSADQRLRQQKEAEPDYPWISAEDLKAQLDRKEKVVVIDTRSGLGQPIIKGALEVLEDDIETWAANKPKSTPIVTYCS